METFRVAIIGAGPAGFYTADFLLKQTNPSIEVDVFDRIGPYGLVRGGVAPDHLRIKSVTAVFDKIARNPKFRFYGNREFGKDIMLEDIYQHYHAAIFSTGAQTDRYLDIPGINLQGSHSATEFVAWYNGHPFYTHLSFDLSCERAAVIGVGNVALDVARILCLNHKTLVTSTDMPEYAWQALCKSRIKEVLVLGRRGPAQAAFDNAMIRELGELEKTDVVTVPEECAVNEATMAELTQAKDQEKLTKIRLLNGFSNGVPRTKRKKIILRFLVSPVELLGDDTGRVYAMRIAKNVLYHAKDGAVRSKTTEETVDVPVGVVFRSVGYQGVPLPGLPFDRGIIPNEKGRVISLETKQHMIGLYVAGWIKRGPTGVIGTNKPCAQETVACILEDIQNGNILHPASPHAAEAHKMILARKRPVLTYEDWLHIDEREKMKGKYRGRPREKYVSLDEMFAALDK